MSETYKEVNHVPEVMYESEGKAPNGESFLSVKKARGYYEYSERPGKDSIAFILYDRVKGIFGLINESKPPLDEREGKLVRMTTAFGGSIDLEKTYQEICQIEVLEESGYEISLDRIHSVGTTLVSTQSSQMLEGFIVDVTSLKKTQLAEYESEVTEEQKAKDPGEFDGNSVIWMDGSELIENSDWKSIWIIARALSKNIVN